MQLIAPLPEALTPGIMAVERFAVVREDDNSTLTMSWHIDLPAATGGPLADKSVLVAHTIGGVQFSYFGRQQEDEAPGWFDRWSGMDHLPRVGACPYLAARQHSRALARVFCRNRDDNEHRLRL